MPSINDNFAFALPVYIDSTGDSYLAPLVDLNGNTLESGEAGTGIGNWLSSAWWTYTPFEDGDAEFNVSTSPWIVQTGTGTDAIISVGEIVGGAMPTDYSTALFSSFGSSSPFTAAVEADKTYYIQVIVPKTTEGGTEYSDPQEIQLIVTGPASLNYGPTVVLQPFDKTVDEGDEVEFISTAYGRPLPITLQWQIYYGPDEVVDIPGATSSPYVIAAATPMYNGLQYRAKFEISDPSYAGLAYSEVATLTVNPSPTIPDDIGDPLPDPWESTDPIPDDFEPDAPISDEHGEEGTDTLLDLIRWFSGAVKRPVRLISGTSVSMVVPNTPLPSGWTQADAADLYHQAEYTANASTKTLVLKRGTLDVQASASFVTNDVRLITSSWRIPDQLPVYGLRPAPVRRISYTFTPEEFSADVEFHFPAVPAVVRRSD